MKFAVWIVACLVACSGSAVPVVQPQQASEDVDSPPTPPAPVCKSESTAEPICQPREAAIPPGFWCAEFRKDKADEAPLTVCYSSAETCARVRKEGLDAGGVVSECQTSQVAYCFTMTDAPKQRVHWRCYDSMKGCTPSRKKAMAQLPKLQFGECGMTNPRRQQTQRTAAR